jgi:asparagine synthetase B (glutamine-hydrolysing)
MCGILLVKSKSNIPLEKHLAAFVKLQNRGPDFCRYQYRNNTFIGQAVLHITGSADYYQTEHANFLAYNGEIYNYKDFGPWTIDTAFVHHAVENDLDLLKEAWGPWAWAWTDGNTVRYASDPQGERCLYQYHDDGILIVCSEVAPILEYINATKLPMTYQTRHWAILDQTPWSGIKKITAGKLYENGHPVDVLDSMTSWIQPVTYHSIDEAYEDFKHTWFTVLKAMTPTCDTALTYSGGLDTSVILAELDRPELYTTNMIGKDPIAEQVRNFLNADEQSRLHLFDVDEQEWAQAFKDIIQHTCMPVQSWSFVGQWIINKNCQQKVLFSGAGADELFGGYDIYQKLNFNLEKSVSPYSENGDSQLWKDCLNAYHGHAGQATLLMDYWYQIAGCDARGVDSIAGAWGIESRNPFLAAPIIKLALNLPFEYKVGTVPKPLIRRLFLERWTHSDILPKKGFTGHCNDALPWLNLQLDESADRNQVWRQAVLTSFRNLTN